MGRPNCRMAKAIYFGTLSFPLTFAHSRIHSLTRPVSSRAFLFPFRFESLFFILSFCAFFNSKRRNFQPVNSLWSSHAIELFLMFFFFATNVQFIQLLVMCSHTHTERESERKRERGANKLLHIHTLPHKNATTKKIKFRNSFKCGPNTIAFWCRVEWGKRIEEDDDENKNMCVRTSFFPAHPLCVRRIACTWAGLTWIFVYLFDIL